MSSDAELRTIIEREEARRVEAMQRAVDAGGLPTAGEAEVVFKALEAAHHEVELLEMRVRDIAGSNASELPLEVTFAHVGIVAALADDVRRTASDMESFASKLEDSIGSLRTTMSE